MAFARVVLQCLIFVAFSGLAIAIARFNPKPTTMPGPVVRPTSPNAPPPRPLPMPGSGVIVSPPVQPPKITPPPATRVPTILLNGASGAVNLRAGPGTDHAVVGQVGKGQQVTELDRQADWVRVSTGTGRQGWVAARFFHKAP